MVDRSGQLVGNYRLDRLLGTGSFAEVYCGQHIHLNTLAALKILKSAELGSPAEQDGFLREARTIAELAHPHIVAVKDFSIYQNLPFLVMEYASRGSLLKNYPRGSRLSLPTILLYVEPVASALQYAHNRKKIHRDVKPANILMRDNGSIMLGDFGIATLVHNSSSRVTEDKAGTLLYMAPEQLQGHPYPASDQYALAIMAYEWIVGHAPFQGTPMEIEGQHLRAKPPSLVAQMPTLPLAVEQVIFKALAKDPDARFASVQDFAQALRCATHIGAAKQEQPVSPSQIFANFITATSSARPAIGSQQPSMPANAPQTNPPTHQTFHNNITFPNTAPRAGSQPFMKESISEKTPNVASMLDLVRNMDSALDDEIKEKRDPQKQKNRRHTAVNGKLISETHHRFIYAFDLQGTWEPEDETPVTIEFDGSTLQNIKCTIVNAAGNKVSIATDEPLPAEALAKILLVDDSAYLLERLRERLQRVDEGSALLGSKTFGFMAYAVRSLSPLVAFGEKFPDESQRKAISQALGSEVTYIIGPPGTGKTFTLAAIVFAHFCAGHTVLIVANTNIAVDNAIMRVADICHESQDANALRGLSAGQIIRYGSTQLEDRLKTKYQEIYLPSIVKQRSHQLNQEQETLNERLSDLLHQKDLLEEAQRQQRVSLSQMPRQNSVSAPLAQAQQKTAKQSKSFLSRFLAKGTTPNPPRPVDYEGSIQRILLEIEGIQVRLAEIGAQISDIEKQVVADAPIVATTLAKTYMNSALCERRFDAVILDEASMALPPAIYLATSHADASVAIIGDPQQLKPIVNAETRQAKEFLGKDIFTWRGISILAASSGVNGSVLLTEQARMHWRIANIVSQHVYRGKLGNSARILDEARWQQYAKVQPLPGQPLILCDTSDGAPQATKAGGQSLINEYHVHCCFALARQVLATLPTHSLQRGEFRIGLVTPYAQQAKRLQRMVKDAGLTDVIRAGTVHRFQGLEAEVMIFDTVTSSPLKPSSFIDGIWGSDAMRLINVAITRAQSKLIMVANYSWLRENLQAEATLRYIIEEAHEAGFMPSAAIPDLEAPDVPNSLLFDSVVHSGAASQGQNNSSRRPAQRIELPKHWGDDIPLYRNDFPEMSSTVCKVCGSYLVLRKNTRTNKPFYGCPNYSSSGPKHSTANLTERDFIGVLKSLEDFSSMTCSQCHRPLIIKLDGDNAWLQCSDVQSCGYGRRILHI